MKEPVAAKSPTSQAAADSGKVVTLRPDKAIDDSAANAAPTVFEIIPAHLTDALCQRIGEQVSALASTQSAEIAFAQMWMLARSSAGFLMMAGAGDQVKAVAIWRLEQWANDVCFRSVYSAGANPETWVPQFIELARAHAKTSGAKHVIWEDYDKTAGLLPEGARMLRQTYAMEV